MEAEEIKVEEYLEKIEQAELKDKLEKYGNSPKNAI